MSVNQRIDFDSLWDYNDPAGTEAQFRDLLPQARAGGDAGYLAELLTQIARTQGLQQRFDDAHRTLDEVETMLPGATIRARIRYLLERGRAFNSSRRREEARPLFLQAWDLAREAGEDFHAVDAAHMVAIAESPEGSLEWNERAIAYAEQSADPRARGWLGSLYNNLGWTYHVLGRYEQALATFEQGLVWHQRAGKAAEARIAAWTVARALRSLGRYEKALAQQRENLRALAAAGAPDGYTQEEIGECLLALGRAGEARPHFARAYALLRGDPWLQRDEPERLQRLAALGYPAPPFDAELAPALAEFTSVMSSTLSLDDLLAMRAPDLPDISDLLATRGMVREDRVIPGWEGDPDILISIFRKRAHVAGGPGFYFLHGGGMVVGDRIGGVDLVLEWVQRFDGVAVSVEYRLAPEHPDPAPIRDCYAGLVWTAAHAGELGFDPDRLIIAGASAGGGLAAGTVLMARDRGEPALAAQILSCPMLDDRNETVSSYQIDGIGLWDRGSNEAGWTALLGDRRNTDQVSMYAAPARATDLSGVPPAYIDCGSAEVFRDEAVAYASAIWAAGGAAELHIWAGGFHSFDGMVPQAAVSHAARETRTRFVARVLGISDRVVGEPIGGSPNEDL